MSTDVVTLTNVRPVTRAWTPVPAPATYAYEGHPSVPPDYRSERRVVLDDLDVAVRWLGYTALVGTCLALSVPTWVWWTLVPCAVAWRRNHVLYVSRRAAHRAGRVWA